MTGRSTLLASIALACFSATRSAWPAGELATPAKDAIPPCEVALRENLAIRHSVTLPPYSRGPAVVSCGSGGPGDCHIKFNFRVPKADFVAAGGLGNPSNYFIENHDAVVDEQSGGAGFTINHDSESVFGTAEVSKGWFGGGQTVRFRVVAKLRENMSDATAALIGKLCSARVLGAGLP